MTALRSLGIAGFGVVALLAAGCGGGGEEVYTAEEFVESINAHGASVTLGPVLTTNSDGVEILSVTLSELAAQPASAGVEGDNHGSGAVIVLEDSAEANAEFERCQGSLSLICFRAANSVLRFEGLFPAEQERITSSIEALATE